MEPVPSNAMNIITPMSLAMNACSKPVIKITKYKILKVFVIFAPNIHIQTKIKVAAYQIFAQMKKSILERMGDALYME